MCLIPSENCSRGPSSGSSFPCVLHRLALCVDTGAVGPSLACAQLADSFGDTVACVDASAPTLINATLRSAGVAVGDLAASITCGTDGTFHATVRWGADGLVRGIALKARRCSSLGALLLIVWLCFANSWCLVCARACLPTCVSTKRYPHPSLFPACKCVCRRAVTRQTEHPEIRSPSLPLRFPSCFAGHANPARDVQPLCRAGFGRGADPGDGWLADGQHHCDTWSAVDGC